MTAAALAAPILFDARPAAGRQAGSRLDTWTKLVDACTSHPEAELARWGMKHWPTCGEAIIYRDSGQRRYRPVPELGLQLDKAKILEDLERQLHGLGEAVDSAERARDNLERSAGRAKAQMRRYVVHNGCTRLWSLTYAGDGQHDLVEWRRDMQGFVRRLRHALGGRRFPYVYVAEWHETGHGLHSHLLLSEFVPKDVVEAAWGHGFVDGRRIRGRGKQSGMPVEVLAARYASKYASKAALDDRRPHGAHVYEVGQGFKPPCVEAVLLTAGEAVAAAQASTDGQGVRYSYVSWEVTGDRRGPVQIAWLALDRAAPTGKRSAVVPGRPARAVAPRLVEPPSPSPASLL